MNRWGLTENVRFSVVSDAVAAGTSDVFSDQLYLGAGTGFDGSTFLVHLGTLTAGQVTSAKIQHSADGSTGWADITGAATGNADDADSNKLLIVEAQRVDPAKPYHRCVVLRGTANAVINGIVACAVRGNDQAVTQSGDVSQSASVTVSE